VQRSEWRWVAAWTLAILAFTSIPYLLGWCMAADRGATFGGFVIGVDDGNSYLAKMGQGARGHWLFHIVYTSEPHDGALFFLFHIILGKLAALLPGEAADLPLRSIWVYHLSRLVFAGGLLAVVYRFAAEFVETVSLRRLAWLMVSLGGGLGWLLLALGHGNWLGSPPLDFVLPEGFTFLTIFSLPHVALGRALLLAGLMAWLKGRGLKAGLLWLVMGLIVPFFPLVAGVVVSGTLLAWWLGRRRFPSRETAVSVLAGLICAPVVLYTAWVFLSNPVMKAWSEQNLILSPPPLHYLAAYLVPAALAVAGGVWVIRQRLPDRYWLLLAWALVVPPLLYAPFNLQRRLIEGYQAPLCILAALGAGGVVWPWLGRRLRLPWMAAAAALLPMVPTSLLLVAGSSMSVIAGQPRIFPPKGAVDTAGWLASNTPEGALVLSGFESGNFLPGWSAVRSYHGHGPETIDFAAKTENVNRFYGAGAESRWRRDFLAENGVDYVLSGPAERQLGGFRPQDAAYLELVSESDGYSLYRVRHDVW
jgi:hypothetical protein